MKLNIVRDHNRMHSLDAPGTFRTWKIVTIAAIPIDAAGDANIKNGVGSTDPPSLLYVDSPAAAASEGKLTIGNFFAAHPMGLTADTQMGGGMGGTIYINCSLIPNNLQSNEALLIHEAFHLLGFDDADLQRGLGISVDPKNTINITNKLKADCVTGKGNK